MHNISIKEIHQYMIDLYTHSNNRSSVTLKDDIFKSSTVKTKINGSPSSSKILIKFAMYIIGI